MIIFCNLVCAYVHKIYEEKFGSCKKSFSWLGQKVNKQIDGSDADGCGLDFRHRMTQRPSKPS